MAAIDIVNLWKAISNHSERLRKIEMQLYHPPIGDGWRDWMEADAWVLGSGVGATLGNFHSGYAWTVTKPEYDPWLGCWFQMPKRFAEEENINWWLYYTTSTNTGNVSLGFSHLSVADGENLSAAGTSVAFDAPATNANILNVLRVPMTRSALGDDAIRHTLVRYATGGNDTCSGNFIFLGAEIAVVG